MLDREEKPVGFSKYPNNSHKNKAVVKSEEPKKCEKVVSGIVKTKEKSWGKRLKEMIFGDDVSSVTTYIFQDVLLPAAKSTLSDMVSGGIEMLLFGEARGTRPRRQGFGSQTSYGNYYKSENRDDSRRKREVTTRDRANHNFDDVILETRGEAQEVLNNLADLTQDYGMATVADLYDLVGITQSFTDTKYGWTDLSRATISRVREGYLLNLPKTIVLD